MCKDDAYKCNDSLNMIRAIKDVCRNARGQFVQINEDRMICIISDSQGLDFAQVIQDGVNYLTNEMQTVDKFYEVTHCQYNDEDHNRKCDNSTVYFLQWV